MTPVPGRRTNWGAQRVCFTRALLEAGTRAHADAGKAIGVPGLCHVWVEHQVNGSADRKGPDRARAVQRPGRHPAGQRGTVGKQVHSQASSELGESGPTLFPHGLTEILIQDQSLLQRHERIRPSPGHQRCQPLPGALLSLGSLALHV